MTVRAATVFGGSGFLGRRIVERLAAAGHPVRVAVRDPDGAAKLFAGLEPVTPLHADVRDEASVARAVAGATSVVNAVSLYREQRDATFEAVHVQGARVVARQAASAGSDRLIHISGIGADTGSASAYIRARAQGERAVEQEFPTAAILRPSVMFGPDDAFFNVLASLVRFSPVLPLFGTGQTRLQPVYVEDVAAAVARLVEAPLTKGKVYELGGPRSYTYRELVELVLTRMRRRRLLLPLPFPVWQAEAWVLERLPGAPLTRDQVALMRHDNVVAPGAPGFAELGLTPASVEAIVSRYLKP